MLCVLLPATSFAKEYTIKDVPCVRHIDIRRYVSDPENILSSTAVFSIDTLLYSLEKQKGIETAVVVLPSIGKEDCSGFAYSLGRYWGVGKKDSNNGLVVLLVIDQRKIQFATGYGLEGDLPDVICKRIQLRSMIPFFKKDDWNRGMVNGIQ